MTEATAGTSGTREPPEVEVSKRRGISLVWLIPIVAAGIGGYLAYHTITSQGPTITVYFETAEGLAAGKTKLKFKSVEVGVIETVSLRPEEPQVRVQCRIAKHAGEHLREGMEFWVVRPRIGMGEISGLGTLVSGAYIAMSEAPPGTPPAREFTGLESPPLRPPGAPGLKIVAHAEKLASLGPGSPVYYREIQVGTVDGHKLADDGKTIEFQIYIEPEHAQLVRQNSRFWNAGGIDVSVGVGKVEVQTESVQALLSGGIAFDSPSGGEPAESGASFWLHSSRAEIESMAMRYGGLVVVVEASQLGSLKVGDLVYYREVPVGSVVSQELARDSQSIRAHLNIQQRYAKLVRTNTVFWNASGISADLGLTGLHVHAESLESLLSGGVAFATPNDPGPPVKPGSVFRLHPEVQDQWLHWSPAIWRGPPDEAPPAAKAAEHGLARFFHHGGKNEEDADEDREHQRDAEQDAAHDEKKHGFLGGLFHRGDGS
jgi:paraquat-inducible protein B